MSVRERKIPEEYVESLLEAIQAYIPIIEQNVTKIEETLEFQNKQDVHKEVISLMNTFGYLNEEHLHVLKEKRERFLMIHKYLSNK